MRQTVWTILRDNYADDCAVQATPANAVTLCGPFGCEKIFAHEWNGGSAGPLMLSTMIASHYCDELKEFRMLDDDGNVMYEGRILLGDEPDAEFRPLNDFGMPNAGCTSIQIRKIGVGEKWKTI